MYWLTVPEAAWEGQGVSGATLPLEAAEEGLLQASLLAPESLGHSLAIFSLCLFTASVSKCSLFIRTPAVLDYDPP